MKSIIIKDVLGYNLNYEDGVILRQVLKKSLKDSIILDFKEVDTIVTSFFATLLTDSIFGCGREYVLSHLKVKNLTNSALKNFTRVIYGTSYNVA